MLRYFIQKKIFFIFFIITNSFSFADIPLLDLNDFKSLKTQDQFVEQFGQALNRYGFVLIANHGISNQKIENVYTSAKDFFGLPLDIKSRYQKVQLNRGYKGYQPERQDKTSDLQEYWHVGNQFSPKFVKFCNIPELSRNVWPKEVPLFRKSLNALYREIFRKSQPLLEACSLYMEQDRKFLSKQVQFGDSIMRVIHYLPSNGIDREWKAPHRDPNLLTIIVGVSMEGLELQLENGDWINVPFVPDAIIVSASNMLESLSNGLIRSAPHKVEIHETGISRYSIPFFFHVQRNLPITPLPECVARTGGKAHYPAQTAEEALKGHNWFEKR